MFSLTFKLKVFTCNCNYMINIFFFCTFNLKN